MYVLLLLMPLIVVGVEGLTPTPPKRLFGWFLNEDERSACWTVDTTDEFQPLLEREESLSGLQLGDIRGGARAAKKARKGGLSSLITNTKSFWASTWQSTTDTLSKPFKNISLFKSGDEKKNEAILAEIRKMPIQQVTVPNSTVIPRDVIDVAARRAGMIGKPLNPSSVQDFARAIKRWYQRKGYVLHSVTGATLQADSKTAEISVEEPKIHARPVQIINLKEMVIDEETGELMTFRQYKDYVKRRNPLGAKSLSKKDLNTTYVTSPDVRTSPEKIAKALKLDSGSHFTWNGHRWLKIAQSGIFRQVVSVDPSRMPDGTAQIQVVAIESAPRNLDYGITKSLYTGGWEGEADFQHKNLLGGGECFAIQVKRGAKDAEPSVRLKYSDDKFGMEGGYDVELFSDFIGNQFVTKSKAKDATNNDDLLDRKGISLSLRNPIDPSFVRQSTVSASLERTSTRNGQHEKLGSATLGVGPFYQDLPMDSRSNVGGSVTTGSRVGETESKGLRLLPYASFTGTTRQIIPLTTGSSSDSDRPLTIAFQHSAMASTRNLPRHEQNKLGIASRIRGYSTGDNGPISTSLTGSTEVRIPFPIPAIKNVHQDATVVLFGDWLVAQQDQDSSFFRKSSIGVGIRKSIQGIPLKYDVCYNKEGKVRAFFGLGNDFDV